VQLKSFIEITEHARGYLNHVIESLPREKWGEAGPSGGWSLKDVLAHIAWHDDAMIEVCEKRDLVGSVWWTLPMHERNNNIYSQYKDASTEVVQEFFEASYEKMLAAVKTLSWS